MKRKGYRFGASSKRKIGLSLRKELDLFEFDWDPEDLDRGNLDRAESSWVFVWEESYWDSDLKGKID